LAVFFTNIPFFTSDKTQFPRLVILAFLSSISLGFFVLYLLTYPQKVVTKDLKNKETHTFSYWIGYFVISGILAIFISILFGFISMPFMQTAEGLSLLKRQKLGQLICGDSYSVWFPYHIIIFFCFQKSSTESLLEF
jgi:hypothetical protein